MFGSAFSTRARASISNFQATYDVFIVVVHFVRLNIVSVDGARMIYLYSRNLIHKLKIYLFLISFWVGNIFRKSFLFFFEEGLERIQLEEE